MKKNYLISFVAFLFVAANINGCKKNNDNAPSRIDLLTSRNWRMSAFEYTETDVNSNYTTTSDAYAKLMACERDDFIEFRVGNSLVRNEGLTRCNAPSTQVQGTGTWEFNSDQTKLLLRNSQFAVYSLDVDIVELSSTTLHMRTAHTIGTSSSPLIETVDITYTAI